MDTKFETLDRLVKNGSISFYEALALLDWGSLDRELKKEPFRKGGNWAVIYSNRDSQIWQFEVYTQSSNEDPRKEAMERYRKLIYNNTIHSAYLVEITDNFLSPVIDTDFFKNKSK